MLRAQCFCSTLFPLRLLQQLPSSLITTMLNCGRLQLCKIHVRLKELWVISLFHHIFASVFQLSNYKLQHGEYTFIPY